jgi:hypothetical protein
MVNLIFSKTATMSAMFAYVFYGQMCTPHSHDIVDSKINVSQSIIVYYLMQAPCSQ